MVMTPEPGSFFGNRFGNGGEAQPGSLNCSRPAEVAHRPFASGLPAGNVQVLGGERKSRGVHRVQDAREEPSASSKDPRRFPHHRPKVRKIMQSGRGEDQIELGVSKGKWSSNITNSKICLQRLAIDEIEGFSACQLYHCFGQIDSDNLRAPLSESEREDSRAAAEIENFQTFEVTGEIENDGSFYQLRVGIFGAGISIERFAAGVPGISNVIAHAPTLRGRL